MKKKSLILSIASLAVVGTVLFSCGKSDVPTQSATNNSEIEVSEQMNSTDEQNQAVDSLSWIQLGNLTSHPELRKSIEEALNITTDSNGNKDGMIYINPKTLEQDNNSTLFSAMHNTKFTSAMFGTGMSSAGATEYVDVEEAEEDRTAALAAINAYFELLPDTEANTFNGSTTLTRAQAMTLFMRAITPVNESNNPTANTSFTSAVGSNIYTDYASYVDKYAYLNTSNGLDATSFDGAMTKGEFICMLTNFFYEDYKENNEDMEFFDTMAEGYELTYVLDAGNISLAEAISNADAGCPTDMYNTFKKAVALGLQEHLFSDSWDESISKSDSLLFLTWFTNAYVGQKAFSDQVHDETSSEAQESTNININDANDPNFDKEAALEKLPSLEYNSEEYRHLQAQISIAEENDIATTTGKPIEDWGKKAKAAGADSIEGWCWVYINGKAAGNQPTYAIYMKEGSPDYGKRYEVGDLLPNGHYLHGTTDELREVVKMLTSKKLEAAAKEVYIDENGNKCYVLQ